jgi:2-dehydropantoate 2-reductase
MKVAVIGCGAIGGLLLGYLSDKAVDILGVVRDSQSLAFSEQGLLIEGVRGKKEYKVKADTKLKERVDLAIFSTKINDIEEAIKDNLDYLKDAIVFTTQNGIAADYILSKYFPKERIITGIVMFGATFYPPNKVIHNFEGELIMGNIFDKESSSFEKVKELIEKTFTVSELDNIKGAKYLKVFINLNNCIPAILGLSMQEAFGDLELAELAICLNKEAYQVVTKSGIELAGLPTYPKERLQGLVSMERFEASKLFSKIMTSLSDKPLYGSILQSIKRGRKSEIDYINGEIVDLARKNDLKAPLNEKIVELVHMVEQTNKFLSKEDLKDILQREASRMSDYND